jgi:uroporphyrinogen decarboxylase
MTSRERVLKAFDFQETEIVPRWCGASDEFWTKAKVQLNMDDEGLRKRFGDDFRRVFARYRGPDLNLSEGATWKSPFGVEREGIGYGQPLSHPLAELSSLDEVEDYPWPDPQWMDPSGIRSDADKWGGEFAVLGGDWSPFWHDAIDLLGHENLYYKMYDYPEIVKRIFEKVTDYYIEVSRSIFDEAADVIDIFFIGNDLGGQTGPLLGVDLYREFLNPSIKRYVDLGHSYGLKVMMHCCGGYRPLIPDLIDAGMDGLHALQPDAGGMEPEGLKKDFGRDIILNGGVDSHHVLINGSSPDFVKKKTLEVLEIMAPGGGYIAGASHDTILEETPVENVLAMFDAVAEFRNY